MIKTKKRKKAPARIRRGVARMIADHDLRMHPQFHACLGRTVPTTKVGTVRLNGGPLVKPETLALLEHWQKRAIVRMSTGQLLDRLAAFAHCQLFSPNDEQPKVTFPL